MSSIIPATEIIVSKAHHVRIVPFIVKPKNSLNNQNPGSFGGLKITLPAPTANTISSGLTPVRGINGATIPPAVSAATVADPTEVLITAAINHAINNGNISEP